MFSKSELQTIDLCLMVQISEMKEKLNFYKSCRMYERFESCQRSLNYFEELRKKVICLENAVEQIEVKV